MFRRNLILLVLLVCVFNFTLKAQKSQNNRWSIDVSVGGTNAVKPYSPDYWSNTVGFLHTSAGTRFMFNSKFGVKLDLGYDRIKNDESGIFFNNGNSLPFQSNYFRTSLQGVLDIGRLTSFENFTNRFSLLLHTGGGLSLLTSKVNPESDKMVNFMFGLTPQIKLSKRLALNFDASFIWHIYQQYTFDMYNPVYKRGFDGFVANATVGLNIYLGKQKEHSDWTYTPCFPDMSYLEQENKKLDSLNKNLKINIADGDGDGVVNIADLEKETPIGDSVDCDGVSLKNKDSDKDGVSDLIDKCKDFPGDPQYEGCPKDIYSILTNQNGNNSSGNDQNNTINNNQNNNSNNIHNTTDSNNSNNSNNNSTNNQNNSNNNNSNNNSANNQNNSNSNNSNNNSANNQNSNNTANNNQNNSNNNNANNSNNSNSNQPVSLDKSSYSSISDVQFELNKKVINPKSYTLLNEIVSLMKENPSAVIALEGHTDITGESSFNDQLAFNRANSLKDYLVNKGIDANRIQIASFGESKPKYLNNTPTGRSLNRRVEIYIKN
jgi:outer membrane protein OmpA-like peptidoglycan-associated protein